MGRTSQGKPEASTQGTSRPKSGKARRKSTARRKLARKSSAQSFVRQLKDRQTEWDYEAQARQDPTLLVRRTLRSGQRVRYSGNVVVLGDVNPGAEIWAGGDIVVMGWLRGMAQAGAEGNDSAKVSAFRLDPTQLRIGQHIGRAPDHGDAMVADIPEVAEVRDGQLIIDRWQASVLTAIQSAGR